MAEDETGWSEKSKRPGAGKGQGSGSASDSAKSAEATGSTTPSRPSKRENKQAKDSGASVVRSKVEDPGARKVAKAAATAGQRDVSFVSRLGFPALIALVCVLGISAVYYGWSTRDALASPSSADHWHSVYGVFDCTSPNEDKYVPPFLSQQDLTGIHSHGDGVIHIHPFVEAATGPRAVLGHFMDEMGFDITPEAITLDNGVELAAGTECADGSGPASVRVMRWRFDSQAQADNQGNPDIFTEGFRDINFTNDRNVFIIALAADDTEIPLPPDARFEVLNNVAADIEYNPDGLIPQDTGVADVEANSDLVPEDTGVGATVPEPAETDTEAEE